MASKKVDDRRAKAAAARAEQQRRETRRRILTIGSVVLVVALIIGGAVWFSLREQDKNEQRLAEAASAASEYGVTIGPDGAPHKVVIYEDFLCPYCGDLEEETRDDLTELAADGKVQVEYRPFDLLSQAIGTDYPIRAANAFAVVLDAAGPHAAKKMHDLLYENQPSEQNPDTVSDDDLVDLAVEAGAKEAEVRAGIENLAQEDWVTSATQAASDAGVSGTPTIILDGQAFNDGRTIEELADNLIAELQ